MSTKESSAFKDQVRPDGRREYLFNGPGDGGQHGHVVENQDGSYQYARDVEGNVYIDRRD
ncbi:MAG TPA: hypothetical protein VMV09_07870 [Candidatus Saccharimonadales bacterium]|nr:hypothetical protein [Candidatus Saccharimonadales bacterium]